MFNKENERIARPTETQPVATNTCFVAAHAQMASSAMAAAPRSMQAYMRRFTARPPKSLRLNPSAMKVSKAVYSNMPPVTPLSVPVTHTAVWLSGE